MATIDRTRAELEERQRLIVEEASTWVEDILRQGLELHRAYLAEYVKHVTEGGRNPRPPLNLHSTLAKLVREEVLEQATLLRRKRTR